MTDLLWHDTDKPCRCGAKMRYNIWESSDGAYEDYFYKCDNGHEFWIDGPDS